jgi:protease II
MKDTEMRLRNLVFLCCCLMLIIPSLTGQHRSIQVKVMDTQGNPLPFANIYAQEAGVGASTGDDGVAVVHLPVDFLEETLVVSYVGYATEMVPLGEYSSSLQEVALIPMGTDLAEVVVTGQRPPNPKKLIKAALRATSENYSPEPTQLTSLYRETIRENEHYIQLNEAIVQTHFTGYPQKRLDRTIWKDWYYDDSYAFDLEGDRFFYPLLKDFNTKADQQRILATRKSKDWSRFGIETVLVGDPLLLFAFDKIKYQYDFFNPKLLDDYSFRYEGTEMVEGGSCHVISFLPKKKKRRFVLDQGKKLNQAIYVGRVHLVEESLAVARFEYRLAVDRNYGFFQDRMPLDYVVKVNYQFSGLNWHIQSIEHTITRQVAEDGNGTAVLHTAQKSLFVLDYEENARPFPDSVLFKSTRYSAIRTFPQTGLLSYWEKADIPDRLAIPKSVEEDLSYQEPLPLQFEHFQPTPWQPLEPPKVETRPFDFRYHGQSFPDPYHWITVPDHMDSLQLYLGKENAYARHTLGQDRDYQRLLFNDLNSVFREPNRQDTTQRVPGSLFWEEDSTGGNTYWLQLDSMEKVSVFSLTDFRQTRPVGWVNRISLSPDQQWVAVQYEMLGVLGDSVWIYPLQGDHPDVTFGNIYDLEWYDNQSICLGVQNSLGRSEALAWYSIAGQTTDTLYVEPDSTFDIALQREGNHVFMTIQSKTENEWHLIESKGSRPMLRMIQPRQKDMEHQVRVDKEEIFLLSNGPGKESTLKRASLVDPLVWKALPASRRKDYLDDFVRCDDFIVGLFYRAGEPVLMALNDQEKRWKPLKVDRRIGQYQLVKVPSNENKVQWYFSSPQLPWTKFQYDLNSHDLTREALSEVTDQRLFRYNRVTQHWARSQDGVKVPLTVVQNQAPIKRHAGLVLKVYGAYGANTLPAFSAREAVLLQHGYTLAYAHVRGESLLGPDWYAAGRGTAKMNSFLDYIACAQYLIDKEMTDTDHLVAYGNSAGGLVVGWAINEYPGLFHTAILDHPYLDVLNTMMNDSLPLTIDEYKEWGNPNDKDIFHLMQQYSPYQNIRSQSYPHVIVLGSFHDFQTPIGQIAKYVAALRAHQQGDGYITLLTDFDGGHMGSRTGKEWIKRFSQVYGGVYALLSSFD